MLPKRRQKKKKVYRNTGNKCRRRTGKKTSRQRGGFLSRYDFAYAGRDVVNQEEKLLPALSNKLLEKQKKNAQSRINQVIQSGGAEIERILPKTLRGSIEDVYKIPLGYWVISGSNNSTKFKRKYCINILYFVIFFIYNNQTIIKIL